MSELTAKAHVIALYQNKTGDGVERSCLEVDGWQNMAKRKRLKERSIDAKRDGCREWGNLWSRVLLCLYTWGCTAGGKEGNGVQMFCIKSRTLNFNRYITVRSPAALPSQRSKPPSTFLTLLATATPSHQNTLSDSPFLFLITAACPMLFFLTLWWWAVFSWLYSLFSPVFTGTAGTRLCQQSVASFELRVGCFKTNFNTHTHVSNVHLLMAWVYYHAPDDNTSQLFTLAPHLNTSLQHTHTQIIRRGLMEEVV